MMREKGLVIPPDAYPRLASKTAAAGMSRALRSAVTAVKAARIIEGHGASLREAVKGYVAELESAGSDYGLVSDMAHEIRGLAETAGMPGTGRIADGLCRYFDDSRQGGLAPDAAVVALHVSAIGRAARDPNPLSQMSDAVARELRVLAQHSLAESGAPPLKMR
jgi:hypothetical protein